MSVSREVSRFIGWIILNDMYDTLKRFGILRWAGEDGEKLNVPLVNIAIQMVCLWPVGILNLVGHNEKYWLTTNIIVSTYKIKSPFLHFIIIFFFTITHSPLNHTVQIHVPCTACKVISLKFMDNFFYHCWWSSACPPLCHSVQFTSSLSSHLLKPHCCFYRGPHKPVFISQSMPWLCAEVSNRYLFFTGHCWFFLHLWYDDSPRDCLETTNRSFSRGRGE